MPKRATLNLIFNGKSVFDPRITFTRSTTKTYTNSLGVATLAAIDEPVIDYNPTTLACEGFRSDIAATNILLNSLLDGTNLITQSCTVTAVPWAISFTGTGTITLSGASTDGPIVGTSATGRTYLIFTPAAGSLTLTVTGTVKFANLELTSPTPFIPTAGSQVTRTADVAVMTGANFSNWYNQTEGCFVVKYKIDQRLAGMRLCSASDGTLNNFVETIAGAGTPPTVSTGAYLFVTVGGVNQGMAATGTLTNTVSTERKVAVGYRVNDLGFSNNGAAASTDTVATLPTVDRLYIGAGNSGTLQPCCWIQSITYYSVKPTSAQLAALSAL